MEGVNGKSSLGARTNGGVGGVGGVNGRVEGRRNGGVGGKPFGAQVQVYCVYIYYMSVCLYVCITYVLLFL